MSETKRITPEEVLAAYAETGLKPKQCEWAWEDINGVRGACGLGAIYSNQFENGFVELINPTISEFDLVGDSLGLSQAYVNGFVYGFDGHLSLPEIPSEKREETERGFADGKAAWEAVKHLAVNAE